MDSEKSLKQVVEEQRKAIMQIPGVIGIAVGMSRLNPGEKCILVYTSSSEWPVGLPRKLGSYPVEIDRKSKGFHAL
jgi:hypothetical protein